MDCRSAVEFYTSVFSKNQTYVQRKSKNIASVSAALFQKHAVTILQMRDLIFCCWARHRSTNIVSHKFNEKIRLSVCWKFFCG